jgi:hypothetical protein
MAASKIETAEYYHVMFYFHIIISIQPRIKRSFVLAEVASGLAAVLVDMVGTGASCPVERYK